MGLHMTLLGMKAVTGDLPHIHIVPSAMGPRAEQPHGPCLHPEDASKNPRGCTLRRTPLQKTPMPKPSGNTMLGN